MSKLLKSHAVGLPEIKNQQVRKFEICFFWKIWFVYAYVKKAKNRKINDKKGGEKQQKQDS